MLPALPSAQALTPAAVAEYAAQIVAWADTVENAAEVTDAKNKWAAITEYIRRTSREGVAEAEGALRLLEARVGLLIERRQGERSDLLPPREEEVISGHQMADFRTMAEHIDIVKQVIAESDDASPPSRRKVLTAISARRDADEIADELAEAKALAPKWTAALAALPPEHRPDWLVVLRFHSMHVDDVRYLLPNEAEVIDMTEEP